MLSGPQIAAFAAQAGPGDIDTATAVALAESGGNPDAVGDQGTSFGLWQIHLPAHPDVTRECALDPACAARAARVISNGWSNFHPWSTFNSGAYRQFVSGGGVATLASVQTAQSLAGQAVVGTTITTPWLPGAWEVTQGWGQTDYDGEPEGHGFPHWHAGVDIGCDSGTMVFLPAGLSGTAKTVDNPGGYGTALVVQLDSGLDVWLGHLRQRLVADGEQLRAGQQLAVTNSTGNSTGPHLHFEVRPKDARYGTDLDPSALLLSGSSAQLLSSTDQNQNPYNPLDPRSIAWDLQHGFQTATAALVAGGQVALGGGMLLGGLLVAGYGLRGKNAAQLQRDVGGALRRRPEPEPRRTPRPALTGAAATRVRQNLQPRRPRPPRPAPDIVSTTTRSARLDPRTGLPRGPRPPR